ncbi:hypothetical protein [Leucobacter sp.]
MVHVAGSLPTGEANGLEAHSLALAKALSNGRKHFIVGVVETDSVKTKKKDLSPDPTIAFTRVELVPFEGDLEEAAADLLQALGDARRGGAGQQSFDLKGEQKREEPEIAALESGPGYYFQVRDLPAGRFGLYLCTQHVEGVGKRGNLMRSELGEVAPGEYQLHELPESLRELAAVLIEEWETNTGSSVLVDEDVVDAEVVEDDEYAEDQAEESADDEDGEEEE